VKNLLLKAINVTIFKAINFNFLGVYRKLILKWILKKYGVRMGTGSGLDTVASFGAVVG
jgi:hypothetical protein